MFESIQNRFPHFEIVWRNVWIMAILHIAGFYGFYLKFYAQFYTHLFAVFYVHCGAAAVGVGRHRYFCHRSFKGNRFVDALLTVMAFTTFQQSIYLWCRDHRLHHKHSDTDADPYNSSRGFFFAHMGWFLVRKHKDVKEKGKSIDMSDLESNPFVMFEHKYSLQLALIFTVLVPILVPWYFWGECLTVSFFACTAYRYLLMLHGTWTVNSIAHMFGMRNYDKNIQPTENFFVSTLTAGEGYHNYHHIFPWDYKASEFGPGIINLNTAFIDLLAFLGCVTERRTASKEVIDSRVSRSGIPEVKRIRNILKEVAAYALFIIVLF